MSARRRLGMGPSTTRTTMTETGPRLLPVEQIAAEAGDQEHDDPRARAVGEPVPGRRRQLGTRDQ
ncbi:hypothetical protein [Streptomyces sp. NPDC051132]|uniref:hypothetical protein n=1 Tax=unclassified Streptomyces TaxID=2593676 RepID=UPI00342FD80C